MIVTISKDFSFEASHVLPRHPGKCSHLHGHSWKGTLEVTGTVNTETGFVIDYATLKEIIDEHIIKQLDHKHLGYGRVQVGSGIYSWFIPPYGEEFYPSSENMVVAIARIIEPLVANYQSGQVRLTGVRIRETCTSEAYWRKRYSTAIGEERGIEHGTDD